MAAPQETRSMALFCDFENVALGVRDAKYAHFNINRVLEKLLLKGSIVVKKAYCDWERYKDFKAVMHGASFELIEIPHLRQSGKNSADIRMVVDALDLCYTKSHVDTFVIISGDSDFSPLVSKLRENAKVVIGVGVKNSSSDLLIANCDEFIFYDDLVREDETKRRVAKKRTAKKVAPVKGAKVGNVAGDATGDVPGATAPEAGNGEAAVSVADAAADASFELPGEAGAAENRKQEAIDLVVGTVEALLSERGEGEKLWGSMVKQTLKRRNPGFNESYYGFRAFSDLLEEGQKRKLLVLERDDKSGGYVIRLGKL